LHDIELAASFLPNEVEKIRVKHPVRPTPYTHHQQHQSKAY
jgi:hypothetical protein